MWGEDGKCVSQDHESQTKRQSQGTESEISVRGWRIEKGEEQFVMIGTRIYVHVHREG